MPHTTRVIVEMPDGSVAPASRNTCNNLESAQKGQWLIPGKRFQVFKRNPDNDGSTGEWKGRHSGDNPEGGPEFRVMQLDRGIPAA